MVFTIEPSHLYNGPRNKLFLMAWNGIEHFWGTDSLIDTTEWKVNTHKIAVFIFEWLFVLFLCRHWRLRLEKQKKNCVSGWRKETQKLKMWPEGFFVIRNILYPLQTISLRLFGFFCFGPAVMFLPCLPLRSGAVHPCCSYELWQIKLKEICAIWSFFCWAHCVIAALSWKNAAFNL